ncbi:MAG: hypothetical protein HY288_11120 [Planctomycetia bacterium]|nr:hypothetical protein [Planctomycetia bacterium]
MDFLNKAYSQLADLFKSMTAGARVSAALLLVVTVVSIGYLFNQQVGGPDAYLMGGEMFSAGDLRDMEAAFGKANLSGAQVEGGRIKVARGQQSVYMAALADAGAMPAEFGDFMKKAASSNSFIPPNRLQQEALAKSARNHDLQLIINKMRGVDKCAVQIDEKVEKVKSSLYDQSIITASVSVQTLGNRPLDEMQVSAIRGLVASSVAGMKPAAVTVIDLTSGRLFSGNGGAEIKPGGAIGDYADYKKRHEMDWQQKISHVLSYIPGVLVTTNVELDPEVVNEQKSTEYDPAKAVVFKSREVTGRAADAPSTGRRSDTAEQNSIHQPATMLSSAGLGKNDEAGGLEQERAVPTTEKFVVREGRTPTRVTVSVAVPNSYYEKIWRQQNPTPEGQTEKKPDAAELDTLQESERKKIETAVLTLLPVPGDKTSESCPQVTVSTFYQVPQPVLPEVTALDNALAWTGQYWSTLSMILLALVSLIMLRGMVKAAPAARSTPTEGAAFETRPTLSLVADGTPGGSGENTARGNAKRRADDGPSLRDELADIVRDDPDAAVSILRTWIGNAS